MKNKKALHIGLFAALSAIVAAPSMAELRQECLFTGEVLQKQADAPIQIRFTGINDGENARCKAKGRGARSTVQFKATPDVQSLPEGSEVLYRYQQRKDGDDTWELVSTRVPVLLNAGR